MVEKIKNKNLYIYIMFILMLFPFFRITILTKQTMIRIVYFVLELNSFLLITFLCVKKNYRMSKIITAIIAFFLVMGFSTIINFCSIKDYLLVFFRTITPCLIVDYGVKYYKKEFFKSMSILLKVIIYTNLAFILIYSEGMYFTGDTYTENWLLGSKNFLIVYTVPALIATYISTYLEKRKFTFRNYIFLLICIFPVVMLNCSAAIIGLTFVLCYATLPFMFNYTKITNIYTYYMTYVILFFGVVIFRLHYYLKFIIVDILHKDLSFTGRIEIWDRQLPRLKDKLLLGYGYLRRNLREPQIGYTHSHNQVLEVLNQCGIFGLIAFLIILYMVGKELYKYRNFKEAKFLSVMILCLIMTLLVEYYSFELIFYNLVIVYNIKHIIQAK